MQKKMAVEPENQEYGLDKDGEAGEVSSILIDLQNLKSQRPHSQQVTLRKFHSAWKNVYRWLQYD